MAKYVLGNKEVSEEEFYKEIFKSEPFFLDEFLIGRGINKEDFESLSPNKDKTEEELLEELKNRFIKTKDYIRTEDSTFTFTINPDQIKKSLATTVYMSKAKGENVFSNAVWKGGVLSVEEAEKLRKIAILNSESEEDLETILKRNMSIGIPDWKQNDTGGTVFEKLQNINIPKSACINPCNSFSVGELKSVYRDLEKENVDNFTTTLHDVGIKENKNKPQLSILFKQFPQALEALSKCSEYGNQKYKETDKDFLNFKRVEGGSKTYADAGLRHRLELGLDESGLPHQYHVAWNAIAELQLWIEENNK